MASPLKSDIFNPSSLGPPDAVHPSEHIPGYEWRSAPGFPLYLVSNGGHVWSIKTQFFAHLYSDKKGGHLVHLMTSNGTTWIMLPKLVAACFVPNDDLRNTHVAHRNKMRTDNRAENLYWVNRRELTKEIIETLTKLRDNPRSATPFHLGDEDVLAIYDAAGLGVSSRALADTFGVTHNTVVSILKGETYRNLFSKYHNPQTEA